jgi:AraC-like DNA-binding protein
MDASSGVAAVAKGDCVVVRFSSADYPPHARLDACREIYGRTLSRRDIEPLSTELFHTEATLRRMPGLGIVTARRSAAIYRLRREFIDSDDVVMTVGLTSGYEAEHFDRRSLRRGEAVVFTTSEPAILAVPTYGDYINVRVPRRVLSPLVADLDAAYGQSIPADNAALRLLTQYIGILEGAEAFATSELRRQAKTHVHDLMALAIGATRDAAELAKARGGRAARLRLIKEDIAAHLDHADLSVATLATRHRIKPRWIQRLFEREGTTFTEYLLAQRLARAYRQLSDPRYADQKISTIAFNVGFGDLSYFNRAFRRRYGAAPSDVRAAARHAD